ncbi:hypothetical protein BASA62_003343 [Batrachochytrium salamandrivorans]|nr:hypothetical protein BASA62_003343 [Batrachochytrium salamandrivorans]
MAPLLPLPASSLDIHPSLAATVVTTINDNSHDNTNINYTTGISELMAAMQGIQRNKEATRSKRDEELVRLMLQSLHQMGYSYTALCLQQESGLVLEPPSMGQFRSAVLAGDWTLVETLIPLIDMTPRTGELHVWFLVKQQKYLEFLEIRDAKRALSVLRNELSPLAVSRDQIHKLSSYMMCSSSEELYQKSNWNGISGNSREQLLDALQEHISPSMMIPTKRLNILMDQAIQLQVSQCLYHNPLHEHISLYANHMCDRNAFPITTTHILEEHTDEVWFLAYSPDGTMLASASKDARAIIWDANSLTARFILEEHSEAVYGGSKTGVCILTFARHTEPVTSCAWLPNGERFVSGSLDKNIYLWNLAGDVLCKWTGVRIMDLAISIDGHTLIASSNSTIRLYDLDLFHEIGTLQENDSITSVYVASDGKHLLVNLSVQEIHLWSLEHRRLVRKYVGQKQGRFVIRSCFGGMEDNFVLSGSEDSQVYIWHSESGTLIETLGGHDSCVNCVSWNPTKSIFASASDDHTIRIWGAKPAPTSLKAHV